MPHNRELYKYPSVTTILGILRKPGLEWWFKTHTAEWCDAESQKAKEIGNAIHEAIFNHIEKTGLDTDTNYPQEVQTCVESFLKFKSEYPQIVLHKSEQIVESKKYKYSGTLDCDGIEDGLPIILDWKTGKEKLKIYDEAKYQAVAYACAKNEMDGTKIDRARVVCIGKDAVNYTTELVDGKDFKKCFKIFKHLAAVYHLQHDGKKRRKI